MFRITRLIRFRWLLPGAYLVLLTVNVLLLIVGAGHVPARFDWLLYPIYWPCYVFDLVIPKTGISNPAINLVLCLSIGFMTYFLLGLVVDLVAAKYLGGGD